MGTADHLQVPRHHGLFNHHGIDLGDGTVAHYLEGRKILRSSIKDFCAGQVFNVVIHENASPNGVTLRRAMSRIGEQSYNLLFNNCEHFANWCKTGRHHSNQIEDWIKSTNPGLIDIGNLIPKALFIGLNLLLSKGVIDESSHQKAKDILTGLTKLRSTLLNKLNLNLEEIENWLNFEEKTKNAENKAQVSEKLLLKAQLLADQLNTVENVEAKLTSLLNKASY